MDSLRVNNGIKTIEVNDAGECISILISDTSFFRRFGDMINNFEKKKMEIDQQGKELSEKHRDKPDNDADIIIDTINLYSNLCKDICSEIDKLFGEGCCRKVFYGIEIPSMELIGDFFDQIVPLIQKYANERNQKINLMYNRNRKGARK